MQIDTLLLQYYLPFSGAPAMNCPMEEDANKGRAEKQAQNGGYKMETYFHLLSVLFEGTKVEEKHSLSVLQKIYPNQFHMYRYISVRLSQEKKYICACTGKQPSDTSCALEYPSYYNKQHTY